MASKRKTTVTLELLGERYSLMLDNEKWVGSTERIPGTQDWQVFVSGTALGLSEADSLVDRADSLKSAQRKASAAAAVMQALVKGKSAVAAPKKRRKAQK